MKALKKLVTLVSAAAIVISTISSAYAKVPDVDGHWAAAEINTWIDRGVISGYPDGSFAPEKSITRAEFSSIMSKLFRYVDKAKSTFVDVEAKAWYSEDVSKASAAGIIKGDGGKFRPNDPITRQEAAVIISRAFTLEAKNVNAADKYSDKKSIAAWALDAVNALTSNGYMSGRANEGFAPAAKITRAETVKLIDNILSDVKSEKGTYTANVEKSLLVNADGVILKDIVIKGDLILAQGISDGDVTLDNVKVEGRTIVLGGGENSVHFVNTSLSKLLVIKIGGKVRIVAEGSTNIDETSLLSGAKLEEKDLKGEGFKKVEVIALEPGQELVLNGDFEEITVDTPAAEIKLVQSTVGKLSVTEKAAGAKIDIAADSKVKNLNIEAAVSVTGKGKVETASINANGATIEMKPDKVEVAAGVTANVNGKEIKGDGNTSSGGFVPYTPIESSLNMSLLTNGTSIAAAKNGSTYTFDLTGVAGDVSLNGLKVESTPTATDLKFIDVDRTVAGTNGTFKFSGSDSLIDAYFGIGFNFDGDVSVQTLKSILSGTITKEAIVMNGSSEVKKVTIVVKISNSGNVFGDEEILNCYTIKSTTSGAITATLKTGKETISVLSGSGFYTSLKNMITIPSGYSFNGVAIGSGDYETSNIEILEDLASAVEKGINEITLGDLKAKNITVKLKASSPNNPDRVIMVTFA